MKIADIAQKVSIFLFVVQYDILDAFIEFLVRPGETTSQTPRLSKHWSGSPN